LEKSLENYNKAIELFRNSFRYDLVLQ